MSIAALHSDPHGRRASYLSPVGHSSTEAQQRRREAALRAQNTNRQHAFLAARSLASSSLDLDDLSLTPDGSDSDEDSALADPQPTSPPIASTSTLPLDPGQHSNTPPPKISKQRKSQHKPKHKAWAANLLSHAETLNLTAALPQAIETEWSLVVVPRGKRCLCVTGVGNYGTNTTLLSRVKGKALARKMTVLPPDCLLDCVYDKGKGVLWVLDLIKWTGQWVVDCEADMRFFFLSSKLSELPTQTFLPPSAASPLLVLPAPHVPAPLSLPHLGAFLPTLAAPLHRPATLSSPATTGPVQLEVPLESTGVLLYLNSGHYDSGLTALVGWVPNEAEEGEEGREGMARLCELVSGGAEVLGRAAEVAMEG